MRLWRESLYRVGTAERTFTSLMIRSQITRSRSRAKATVLKVFIYRGFLSGTKRPCWKRSTALTGSGGEKNYWRSSWRMRKKANSVRGKTRRWICRPWGRGRMRQANLPRSPASYWRCTASIRSSAFLIVTLKKCLLCPLFSTSSIFPIRRGRENLMKKMSVWRWMKAEKKMGEDSEGNLGYAGLATSLRRLCASDRNVHKGIGNT